MLNTASKTLIKAAKRSKVWHFRQLLILSSRKWWLLTQKLRHHWQALKKTNKHSVRQHGGWCKDGLYWPQKAFFGCLRASERLRMLRRPKLNWLFGVKIFINKIIIGNQLTLLSSRFCLRKSGVHRYVFTVSQIMLKSEKACSGFCTFCWRHFKRVDDTNRFHLARKTA